MNTEAHMPTSNQQLAAECNLESDLRGEQCHKLAVVQHPVRVGVHHGDVVPGLLQTDSHPPVISQHISELFSADLSAENG